mmetsp:Transcript_91537/g.264077  ORF Transcript_91537/g.264077 Transcript_91537/m.264077 type:complete len:185 (+) Transcript_91537:65-619(+)
MGKAGQAKQVFRTYGSKARKSGLKAKTTEKKDAKAPQLKKGITAGTILILLAGRFRGRRVIFLKQLESGMLLVTGPFGINGVPLRRANQRYCITTSTKVDVSAVDVSSLTDAFFAREQKKQRKSKDAEGMFVQEAGSAGRSDEQKAVQKKVDDAISKSLTADVKSYLKARFSLTARMFPHELKF